MSGRRATTDVRPGRYALSVGNPSHEAPAGWKWVPLLEVARMATGHTPSRKHPEYWDGDIPWMNVGDARPHHGGVIWNTSETINFDGIENSAAVLLPAKTVCLSRTGSIGYAVLLGRPMATSQGFVNWICGPELVPEFLQRVFMAEQSFLHEISEGVAHTTIYFPEVKAFHVCVPSVGTQRNIVAEIEKQFSRLDEAVAGLKRVKANLKRYKAAVLKAAVEGRLVPTEAELARREGRSYETGEQLLQRILETRRSQWQGKGKYKEPAAPDTAHFAELPDGWVWATVEQLSLVVEYGSSAKTNEDSSGVPVFRMGNIVEGELIFDGFKYLSRNHEEFPKLFLQPGDLLFNRTNSPELVGKTAVFVGGPQPYSFASYLIRVRLVDGCLPVFLNAFISSIYGRAWVKSAVTQQVGQANVNGSKLQALCVPLPPVSEQKRIVAEVDRLLSIARESEAEVEANLKRAQALRQAILAKSFSVPARDA